MKIIATCMWFEFSWEAHCLVLPGFVNELNYDRPGVFTPSNIALGVHLLSIWQKWHIFQENAHFLLLVIVLEI